MIINYWTRFTCKCNPKKKRSIFTWYMLIYIYKLRVSNNQKKLEESIWLFIQENERIFILFFLVPFCFKWFANHSILCKQNMFFVCINFNLFSSNIISITTRSRRKTRTGPPAYLFIRSKTNNFTWQREENLNLCVSFIPISPFI